ncbi:hypothetical protein [Roseobacter sp. MH60115]|uniref:hypothetical protein n=1 Tax=Roseobacter sp. MH60115 TaxID=2785324 RepID=UPI0018A2FDF0|nr:hypothetical protein [Roseobacter sp. MH60115]
MATRSPSSQTTSATQTQPDQTDTVQKAKKQAKALAETVSEEAGTYAKDAQQTAISHAEAAKDNVAAEGNNIASALRTAAQEMRSGSPQERTLGQIADGIADMSDAIRDKDLGQIVSDLNDISRRNPAVFLGAAALVGFAAVRFAKASKTGSEDPGYDAARSHASRGTTSVGTSSADPGASAANIDKGGLL